MCRYISTTLEVERKMKWINSQMCVSPTLIGCCAKTPRSPKVVPEDNLDIGIWEDDDDNGNDPRDCEQTIRGKVKTLKTHRQQNDNDTHAHNMAMQKRILIRMIENAEVI